MIVAAKISVWTVQNPAYSFAQIKGLRPLFHIKKLKWKYNMINLTNIQQLEELDQVSKEKALVIFKHSTRCSISNTAFNRFTKAYENVSKEDLPVYYLDLLNHRDISAEIASRYSVQHESPQSLLIKNGTCIHHASHFEIDLQEIVEAAKA